MRTTIFLLFATIVIVANAVAEQEFTQQQKEKLKEMYAHKEELCANIDKSNWSPIRYLPHAHPPKKPVNPHFNSLLTTVQHNVLIWL